MCVCVCWFFVVLFRVCVCVGFVVVLFRVCVCVDFVVVVVVLFPVSFLSRNLKGELSHFNW